MTAEEANKRATIREKMIKRSQIQEEKDSIMKCIESSVNDGCFNYTTQNHLFEETIIYLHDLGYEVTEDYVQYGGTDAAIRFDKTTIKW